jgi:aminoglycoside phosphotransferase (APT) family kinase protein
MWAAFRELPRAAPDVMSHGDLIPGNVLVAGGHLAGLIDVGSFGAADPALDLISAWNLLEAGPRQMLRLVLRRVQSRDEPAWPDRAGPDPVR